MAEAGKAAKTVSGLPANTIPYSDLLEEDRPIILKGVVKDWEIAKRGRQSPQAVIDYLCGFDSGRPVVGYTGAAEIGGIELNKVGHRLSRLPGDLDGR